MNMTELLILATPLVYLVFLLIKLTPKDNWQSKFVFIVIPILLLMTSGTVLLKHSPILNYLFN